MTDDELSVFKGAMDPECATLHASLVTTTLALHAEKNVNERVSCRNKCSDAALCQAAATLISHGLNPLIYQFFTMTIAPESLWSQVLHLSSTRTN
jgi:hypothetical protein|mmetsp:Transcript_3165/g.10863  ORF Transcript_3165/g.10863 Transcript_3165/m.10863 type:complete len:95 (-) Transcript_3165:1514-1798(-)